MPLKLPDQLPAIELLKKENIFVMDDSRAHMQDIRPLKIVILNLMPVKQDTAGACRSLVKGDNVLTHGITSLIFAGNCI